MEWLSEVIKTYGGDAPIARALEDFSNSKEQQK